MYFVTGADGQQYGPADVATLNEWIKEGRVEVSTVLVDSQTGNRVPASSVTGLIFGVSVPSVGTTSNYPRGPLQPMLDHGEADLRTAWIFSTIGIAYGALTGFCCLLLSVLNVFSIAGLIYARAAKTKGQPSAQSALICSIVGICLGPVIGVALLLLVQYFR